MNRSSRLSARELERLSAYLDGALLGGERTRLEARLESDPELRAALQEIQSVAQALRQLPSAPVPRNFTLRPEAAMARPRAAYPALPFATALATVAFLAVFGWDALARSNFAFGAQAPLAAEPLALQAGAPESQAIEEPPGVGDQESGVASSQPSPTPSIGGLRIAGPEATPCPACPTVAPSVSVFANDAVGLAAGTATPTELVAPSSEKAAAPDLVEGLKIGLGVLALGLGAATVVLRRRPW